MENRMLVVYHVLAPYHFLGCNYFIESCLVSLPGD